MSLFTPSGGLVYHLRALRYGATLWRPFREVIGEWLVHHLPPGDELVLVGPSGGHCLPLAHLRRFSHLRVLEPDPLARLILRSRLRGTHVDFDARDHVLTPLLAGAPGLDAVLADRTRAAVLFCNLLGQVHLGLPDGEQSRFEHEFRCRIVPALAGRRWASFHDRWSLDDWPREPSARALEFDRRPDDDVLAAACFDDARTPVTVVDHRTGALFPGTWPRRYFSWKMTPASLHVVEALGSTSRS